MCRFVCGVRVPGDAEHRPLHPGVLPEQPDAGGLPTADEPGVRRHREDQGPLPERGGLRAAEGMGRWGYDQTAATEAS